MQYLPFECDSQVTWQKNDTLRKVEFEGETLSTPVRSGTDGDVLPQPVQEPEVTRERQFSSYETFSAVSHTRPQWCYTLNI